MTIPPLIAKQFRDVHSGGNWTSVNLKEVLKDITWQQATTRVHSFNTIATLVFHTNYYVAVVLKVLQGEPLNAKDAYSFNVPPILSQEDWDNLQHKTFADAEKFVTMIEQFSEKKLYEIFVDEKYESYYRNLTGIIEHLHYHLGQMVLIKKIITEGK